MSDSNIPSEVVNLLTPKAKEDLQPIKNRKQRRYEAKLARSKKVYRDFWFWHRRIMKEMIENKAVQENIVSGKFDHFLSVPEDNE